MNDLIFWDEPKRLANLDTHGLDFADVEGNFDFDNAVLLPASPKRTRAIGILRGKAVALIFARLGTEAISIISLPPASKKERRMIHA